jgi:glutathione synthase/RimK-type ligase-like ATP-grasp enzyme
LLNSDSKNKKLIRKVSKTFSLQNLRYVYQSIVKFKRHLPISNNRKKFIIQNFVEGLKGDYRVIAYGDKYYVLYRENRDDDFRASGSMKFHLDTVLPDGLLNYASSVFKNMNVPYIALDIAVKDGLFYLFEFQALSFGQYTFEKSNGYYTLKENNWEFIKETPDLELEFSRSILKFINK